MPVHKSSRPKRPRAPTSHVARLLAGPSQRPQYTPDMAQRYAELAALTTPAGEQCPVCGQGRGLPKVATMLPTSVKRSVCVVCAQALEDFPRPTLAKLVAKLDAGTFDREKWAMHRLPYFRDWLTSEHHSKLHHGTTEAA